jgi:hypothetical protein
LHAELQLRSTDIIKDTQQLLFRNAINYHINNQVFFTADYCYVQTEPYGAFPVKSAFPENSLWQQVQIKTLLNRIEFINRIRLELRNSKLPVYNLAIAKYELGNTVFTNRARFLARASLPLNNKSIIDKNFYITTFNESFVNFGKKVGANLFDQNRIYVGQGYKLPIGRIEVGFIEQTIVKADGIKIEDNHTFQIALNSTIDFLRKKSYNLRFYILKITFLYFYN